MKTIFKAFYITSISAALLSTSAIAQEPAKPAQPSQEQIQKIAKAFQTMLKQGVAFKDADALRIMKEAQANGGELSMTQNEMIAQVNKWKTTSIPARFQKLFISQLEAKDQDAIALQKKITDAKANDGKFNMTAEKMIALVEKWEAKIKAAKETKTAE